jgi:K(+)-stimulated pyrophosphate-energized sodium pump
MNILIKLMSIVALVIAPTIANLHKNDVKHVSAPIKSEIITTQAVAGK